MNLRKYKSKEDAINDHKKNYRSYGSLKGKFKTRGPDQYRIDRIIDNIPHESVVLDVGCNDGGLGYRLQERCTVYGVDVVPELVDASIDKGVLARVGNAEDLPFKSEMFDAVVMAETLEHVFEPLDALIEVHRVLKKGGIFLGSVPHDAGRMGKNHKADYHNHVFTEEDLFELFGKFFNGVELMETPYFDDFCEKNNIPKDMYQWRNWICREKKG